jgi:GNAT superfamily N-acetyltransferase
VSQRIRPATEADLRVLATVVAGAFHPLAVARWLVPDEMQRLRMFPPYFAIFLEHALAHGALDTTTGREAVAAWLPNTGAPLPPPHDYDRRLAEVAGGWLNRFMVFDALLEEHHPDRPHHYLALLAVRPDRQGQGLGTALLEEHHAHLDETGLPAYLEASSRASRALYLRHGYVPHGHPLVLPNGPLLYPLLRHPLRRHGGRHDGNPPAAARLVQTEPAVTPPASGAAVAGGGHDHTSHSPTPGRSRAGGRVDERLRRG